MGGRSSREAPQLRRFLPANPGTWDESLAPARTDSARLGSRSAPYVEVRPQDSARPFSPGSRIYIADVRGDALTAFDIRDGDQLVLVRRPAAEHGDFAVLPLSAVRFPYGMQNAHGRAGRPDDPLTLWKVYPEASRLRLSAGPRGSHAPSASASGFGETSAPVDAPIHGVLVGILRRPRA